MLETWQEALDILRGRLDEAQFETWLRPIRVESSGDGKLVLVVPDEFFARTVRDNYLEMIKDALWDRTRRHFGIEFEVCRDGEKKKQNGSDEAQNDAETGLGEHLVPWFTFETFVVGPSNQVAHSACEMVAQSPGTKYNPLFIYGGIGLGKTHLLQSVAHAVRKRFPGMRVAYISGETYVNEVMTALKNQTLDLLRHRYRGQCDCLLIDDIQYLVGKEFPQDEFFHTFNELYNARKQIVVTADQFPTSLPKISERLRSRFGWGLIVDIAPPERELCIEILLRKAQREGISLPLDVAEYLAERFSSSVRDLEGALNRVTAHALIRKVPITLDLARRVTERILQDRKGRLTPDLIIRTVADYFGLQASDLKSQGRARGVTIPREIAMWLMRRHTGASLVAIGHALGGRGHSTILSGLRHIEKVMASEPATERAVKDIERQLGL